MHVFLSLCHGMSLCVYVLVSVCVLSLGKKMTRQEDQKHIFNFVWPKECGLNVSAYHLSFRSRDPLLSADNAKIMLGGRGHLGDILRWPLHTT